MIARRLSEGDHLVLAGSQAYLARCDRFVHPRERAPHRIVIRRPRSGAMMPGSLSRLGETVEIQGTARLVVDGAIAARQYAIDGLGIGLLAHQFVAKQLCVALLRRVMTDWAWPIAGFHLMYAGRGKLSPALRDLEWAMRHASA
jgi:DNA-binding transcriptional LysR family regulator